MSSASTTNHLNSTSAPGATLKSSASNCKILGKKNSVTPLVRSERVSGSLSARSKTTNSSRAPTKRSEPPAVPPRTHSSGNSNPSSRKVDVTASSPSRKTCTVPSLAVSSTWCQVPSKTSGTKISLSGSSMVRADPPAAASFENSIPASRSTVSASVEASAFIHKPIDRPDDEFPMPSVESSPERRSSPSPPNLNAPAPILPGTSCGGAAPAAIAVVSPVESSAVANSKE